MITKREINVMFTKVANEYLSKGYVFSLTMRGHQGERMKVDLENGKETIRVRIDTFNDLKTYDEGLELIVERFDRVGNDHFDTLWNGKGEQLYSKRFYEIDRRRRTEVYTESQEEMSRIHTIRSNRYKAQAATKSENAYLATHKAFITVYKWVKRQEGCKTVKLEEITNIRKRGKGTTGYVVTVMRKSGKKELYMV